MLEEKDTIVGVIRREQDFPMMNTINIEAVEIQFLEDNVMLFIYD